MDAVALLAVPSFTDASEANWSYEQGLLFVELYLVMDKDRGGQPCAAIR